MRRQFQMEKLDYSMLGAADAERVGEALSRGEETITGYMPDQSLKFILSNYKQLTALGILEVNWMQAYLHAGVSACTSLRQHSTVFAARDLRHLR